MLGVLTASPPGALAQRLIFVRLPDTYEAGQGLLVECLDELPGEVLCGRFRVWENPDAGRGRTIDLAFVVLRALEDRGNTDAITQFNGGPGAPVTPSAAGIARSLESLRRQRDVLLVDHRGTGNSEALLCDVPFPGGLPSRFATVFPLDHVDACREALEARVDLRQYTTARAMDDLDELRAWLGYSALNLIGGSYGTREAQVFLRRHPEAVRTVVFNGVGLVQDPIYLNHARDLEVALENLFAECASDGACSAAYPDLRATTGDVLTLARERPPQVEVDGSLLRFPVGALAYALRGLLYGRSGAVPGMIQAARVGDWQPLADYYLERQAWVGAASGTATGYHFTVLCAEDVGRLTWSEIEQATAGTFMGDHLIGAYKRVCERWTYAQLPASHFTAVKGDVPALILSGGRDPVTPPSGGAKLAGQLPNAIHVVVPNGGHGQGGPCIRSLIERLIEDAAVEGIDASCVREAPPTRFVLPGGR